MKLQYKFTIALCLIMTSISFSQNISGGLRAGANYSFFTEGSGDNKGFVGYEFGYFEKLSFDKIALQAEINYTVNNYQNHKNSDAKINYNFSFLEVPLIIKYKLKNNLELGAGIKYAFRAKGESTQEFKFDDSSDSIKEKQDLSPNGGFGFLVELIYTQNKFNYGLRVNFGSGEVINDYTRRSANLFIGYTLF